MIGNNTKQGTKGIALLISVLVSSIFFVIAAAVFKIALIEYILSSTGKESQFAFYSADTGAECALYWDGKYDMNIGGNPNDGSGSAFSVYNASSGDENNSNRNLIINNPSGVFNCAGAQVTGFTVGGGSHETNFSIETGGICAFVTVSKLLSNNNGAYGVTPEKTEILSRGYNTCNTASPRRVERTLKVTIQ